jgi:hypothetical protein
MTSQKKQPPENRNKEITFDQIIYTDEFETIKTLGEIGQIYTSAINAIEKIKNAVNSSAVDLAEAIRIDQSNQEMIALENFLDLSFALDIAYLDLFENQHIEHLFGVVQPLADILKQCAIKYPSIAVADIKTNNQHCLNSARTALTSLTTLLVDFVNHIKCDYEIHKNEPTIHPLLHHTNQGIVKKCKKHQLDFIDGLDAFSNALYTITDQFNQKPEIGEWAKNFIEDMEPGKYITFKGKETIHIKGPARWKALYTLLSANGTGWTDLQSKGIKNFRANLKGSPDMDRLSKWIEVKNKQYRINAPEKSPWRK